ncbi:hypothetical protein K2X05_10230 [bacterium]|nr:hypothetical protein [bacterium]
MPLVSGQVNVLSQSQLDENFKAELYWLLKLEGVDYLPKLYDVDELERTIYQEYLGPDLLARKESGDVDFLTLKEQSLLFLEIHKDLIESFQLLKLNHSLSNMALQQGQFKIFDFKWAVDLKRYSAASRQPLTGCKTTLDDELYSYHTYMVKLDTRLPNLMRECLEKELRGLVGRADAKA